MSAQKIGLRLFKSLNIAPLLGRVADMLAARKSVL